VLQQEQNLTSRPSFPLQKQEKERREQHEYEVLRRQTEVISLQQQAAQAQLQAFESKREEERGWASNAASGPWGCRWCSYENPVHAAKCDICQKARESNPPLVLLLATPTLPATFLPPHRPPSPPFIPPLTIVS
jgi:hypothetical protein